jgi:hypothetical protein
LSFAKKLRDKYWPEGEKEYLQTIQYAGDAEDQMQKLLPVLPNYSYNDLQSQLLNFVVWGERRTTPKSSKFPAWFKLAYAIASPYRLSHQRGSVAVRFSDARSLQLCRLGLNFFADGQMSWLLPIRNMPAAAHQSWRIVVSGAEFLNNPTASELATQFRKLAELNIGQPVQRPESWLLPWPLSACLSMDSSPARLEKLSELARQGALGDISDWKMAEQRWLSKGVTLEDLESSSQMSPPFGANISVLGFPYHRFSFWMDNSWTTLPEDLLFKVYQSLPFSDLRSDMANRLLWEIGHGSN